MTPPMDRDELIARLRALVDADDDHIVATEEDLEWLVEQLLMWPRRIHPERTTNDRFLRYSMAATLIAALESRPAPAEQRARGVLAEELAVEFPIDAQDMRAGAEVCIWSSVVMRSMLRFATETHGGSAEAETYRQMHEIATDLGYPSILEALEAAPRATDTTPSRATEGRDETEWARLLYRAHFDGQSKLVQPNWPNPDTWDLQGAMAASYRCMARAVITTLAPSRGEEGSVDREAVLEDAARVADDYLPDCESGRDAGVAAIASVEIAERIRALSASPTAVVVEPSAD